MNAAKAIFRGWTVLGLGLLPLRADGPAETPRATLVEAWGWVVAHQQDVARIESNEGELKELLRGAADNLAGRSAPAEPAKVAGDVDALATARRAKVRREIEERNTAAAREAWIELAKRPAVHALEKGVQYEILQPGTGAPPKPQQMLTLHYTGHRLDGTEFIQLGPYDVMLTPNRLAPALGAAVQKIGPGGAVRVYVPPPLPPGDDVRLGIEPGTATIYEVELIAVRDATEEERANSLLPPAPEPPAPAPSGLPEATIWRSWGWDVAQKTGAAAFHLNSEDQAAWLRGLAEGITDEPAKRELGKLAPQVGRWLGEERRKARQVVKERRLAERKALLEELKRNPQVVEQPDGLRYEMVERGAAGRAKPGDVVIVEYTGRLVDGRVFDRTDNEPLHIEVGLVVAGLNEGLQLIGPGGRIKLYVPPELGYGSENASGVVGPIPADSMLLYDIRLLAIEPAEAKH